jgi:hypothetical protein
VRGPVPVEGVRMTNRAVLTHLDECRDRRASNKLCLVTLRSPVDAAGLPGP